MSDADRTPRPLAEIVELLARAVGVAEAEGAIEEGERLELLAFIDAVIAKLEEPPRTTIGGPS